MEGRATLENGQIGCKLELMTQFKFYFLYLLLLLLITLGGGATATFGQVIPPRFVRSYTAGVTESSRIASIWPTDSGYFASIFKTDSTPSGTYYSAIEVWEIDSTFDVRTRRSHGDTLKEYPDWLFVNNAIPDGLGSYWYWNLCYVPQDTGFWTYYGKFDGNGDTLFERRLPNTGVYDYPWALLPLSNGGGVLSQYAKVGSTQRTMLFFLDATGQILQMDSINPLGTNRFHGAYYVSVDSIRGEIYVPTSDYYFAGSYTYDFRPRIFVFDFQGNLLRSKNYGQLLRDYSIGYLHRTQDNGYVAMAEKIYVDSSMWVNEHRTAIVKLDSNLDVEWTRQFWDRKQYNSPSVFYEDERGNFYLGGIMDSSGSDSGAAYRCYLMKLSPSLDSLWMRMFVDANDPPNQIGLVVRWPAQVQVLYDHSILMLVNNFPNSGKNSVLYRLDSCGYLIDRCEIDTVIPPPPPPPDTLWPKPDGSMIAYPNPSNGLFNLVWDVNTGDESRLRVHDVAGRLLLDQAFVREERPSQLDLSEWRQGVYLIEIRSEKSRVFRANLCLIR